MSIDEPAIQRAMAVLDRVIEAGWQQWGDIDLGPLWQWQEDSCVRVATRNHEVLGFVGAALNFRDKMTDDEEEQFVREHLFSGGAVRRGDITDAGWQPVYTTHGDPLWEWHKDNSFQFVTHDHEVLRVVGAVLNLREAMTDDEQEQFLGKHLLGGRSGTPNDHLELYIVDPKSRGSARDDDA